MIEEVVHRIWVAHEEPSKKINVLTTTGPHVYTVVVLRNIHQSEKHMFDGHIIHDGTEGASHRELKRKSNSWTQLQEQIIL